MRRPWLLPLALLAAGCAPGLPPRVRGGGIEGRVSGEWMVVQAGESELGLRTARYGREALPAPGWSPGCPAGAGRACRDGLRLSGAVVTEWWGAHATGMEHGWVLAAPPPGGDIAVRVEFASGSVASVDPGGLGSTLRGDDGATWRYDGLRAWDASGRPVAVRMADTGAGLELRVVEPVATARWPVTIDPILTSVHEVELTASDASATSRLGLYVAGAGDLDGDGFQDIAAGANWEDQAGADAGAAYVYYGSATGVSAATEQKLVASDARDGDGFGQVAGAGDVNADGYADLLVGAPSADGRLEDGGAAYVYLGSSGGVDASTEDLIVPAGHARGYYLGYSVTGAGDADGDGYDDVAASTPFTTTGSVYVFRGSSAGVDASTEQELNPFDGAGDSWFGSRISGGGDLDGDGYDDLLVGAHADAETAQLAGAVYVFYGGSGGMDTAREQKVRASDGARFDTFGSAVANDADIDADGFSDAVIGAGGDGDVGGYLTGSVYVYRGSASGLDEASEVELHASDGVARDVFGSDVFLADFDADGHADLLVGAFCYYYGCGSLNGAAYVYFGDTSGIDASSEVKLEATDGAVDDRFGFAVSAADVDGDGLADAVVGAPAHDDAATDAGAVYVFAGSCRDEDGDGSCRQDDCDATTAAVSPSATELCNGVDDDCDGTTDEDDAADAATWYADADGDTHGDPLVTRVACTTPAGHVADSTDCDDTTAAVSPSATELCNGLDDDCDGTTDEPDAADAATWYADSDGDAHGDPLVTSVACTAPAEFVADATDCDDTAAAVNPAATELCNGADDDCDGTIDEDCDGDAGVAEDAPVAGDDTVTGGCAGCTTRGPGAPGWGALAAAVASLALARRRS